MLHCSPAAPVPNWDFPMTAGAQSCVSYHKSLRQSQSPPSSAAVNPAHPNTQQTPRQRSPVAMFIAIPAAPAVSPLLLGAVYAARALRAGSRMVSNSTIPWDICREQRHVAPFVHPHNGSLVSSCFAQIHPLPWDLGC